MFVDQLNPTHRMEKDIYTLIIMDNFIHYTAVYLLRNKSEVTKYIKEFTWEAEA